jgi:hypothetical protein
MSKPVFGLLLGGFLGIFDGLTALLSAPETAPQIVGIVIGSTIKGVITGLIIGLVARKTRSLALAVVVGGLVGVALAFPVALMNRYYWQTMLPGGVLGVIVGYATFRHGGAASAVAAH